MCADVAPFRDSGRSPVARYLYAPPSPRAPVHPPPAPPPGGPGRFGGPANNLAKTANRFENVEPRGAAAAFVAAARGQPPPRGASPSVAAAAARASPAAPIVGVSLDMRLGAASPLANGGNNAAAGRGSPPCSRN